MPRTGVESELARNRRAASPHPTKWGVAAESMRKALQLVFGLAALAALALPAAAQRIATGPVVRAGQPFGTITIPSSTVSTLLDGSFPVPGFGFDYTHLAAVNRDLGVRAIIDPATQHQLALARELRREAPAFPTVLPLVVNTNVNQIFITMPPPVVIVQQPAVIEVPAGRVERQEAVRIEAALAPQPVAELGELVLIRNDGRVVFAVGYSVVNGRLIYVTREGLRRSFPLAELDADATLQMNEERGTSLRLPA